MQTIIEKWELRAQKSIRHIRDSNGWDTKEAVRQCSKFLDDHKGMRTDKFLLLMEKTLIKD